MRFFAFFFEKIKIFIKNIDFINYFVDFYFLLVKNNYVYFKKNLIVWSD